MTVFLLFLPQIYIHVSYYHEEQMETNKINLNKRIICLKKSTSRFAAFNSSI
jgi:hypothetical protein